MEPLIYVRTIVAAVPGLPVRPDVLSFTMHQVEPGGSRWVLRTSHGRDIRLTTHQLMLPGHVRNAAAFAGIVIEDMPKGDGWTRVLQVAAKGRGRWRDERTPRLAAGGRGHDQEETTGKRSTSHVHQRE